MTRHRSPYKLPDSRALLVAAVVIFGVAWAAIGIAGSNDQRFARERLPQPLKPTHALERSGAGSGAAEPAGVPPDVAAAAAAWPLPNHDYGNRRATLDSGIDSSNVSRLGLAWSRKLHGAGQWGAAASGPLIAGDTIYFQDLTSDVFALDLRTGGARWVAKLDQVAFGPNGPALGYGNIYAQDGNHGIVALDARTGRQRWHALLAGPTGQQQPTVFGGFVYTGIAAARKARAANTVVKTRLLAPGSSGFAYGIRAGDGHIAWSFRTVTAGFWGDPTLNAGAGIWMPAAIDTRTGTTFWSTGNPVPAPGSVGHPNAVSRPGPNLYSNTVLALDGRTGKLRWYRQVLPHDLLHHDLQNPPVLLNAGGRELVIASGKMGVVYGIDRVSGKLVWRTPVGKHLNDGLTRFPGSKGVTVYPGFWGGIETPLAADAGVIYALTNNLPTPYNSTAWGALDGEMAVHNLEGRTTFAAGDSQLVALDAASGKIKWARTLPAVGFGGATVVNDLVFTATYDGKIYALRRRDGKIVWRFQAPGGIVAWPAVARNTIVWPIGIGRQPVLIALRLGGKPAVVVPRARPVAPQPK